MRSSRFLFVLAAVLAFAACNGETGETTTTGEDAPTTEAPTTTAGESPTTTVGETPGDSNITIANFAFSGASSVSVGTTVTVTNEDSFSHTWTSDDGVFDSGSLSQGETFDFTFEEAGEYAFTCAIHPTQMMGTITVEG